MKTFQRLYVDGAAGVAGDMLLAALVDLGVPWTGLAAELAKLRLPGLKLTRRRVRRAGMAALQVRVSAAEHGHVHRNLAAIERQLQRTRLAPGVRAKSREVFRELAQAEARIHGVPVGQVHFHELGAWDTLADIVGVCYGLYSLGVEGLDVGPINCGTGVLASGHGLLPVPAPATLELLKGFYCFQRGPAVELATPTGAALLKVWGRPVTGLPSGTPKALGYGAGSRDLPDLPNLLRVVAWERTGPGWREDEVVQLATDLDDCTPQVLGFLCERLRAAGALDVVLQPIYMKKNRLGTRLEAWTRFEQAARLAEIIFRESTTLGLRVQRTSRWVLPRTFGVRSAGTDRVRLKQGFLRGERVTATPEYEDAQRAAQRQGRPLKQVLMDARTKSKE